MQEKKSCLDTYSNLEKKKNYQNTYAENNNQRQSGKKFYQDVFYSFEKLIVENQT